LKKLQNAIHRAAGMLLLAGSFGVVCAPAFAQTQPPTKPPTSRTSTGATKPAVAPKTNSTPKKTGATKTAGSSASHTSRTTSTTGHTTNASTKKKSAATKSTRVKMQTAPTPDRIREIQAALTKAGVYDGDPTGNWDTHTVAAMTRFQQSNGLTPTGKLDALTLQKLGFGSDTAGKGAPHPATTRTTTVSSSTGTPR
jgi:cytoskeletal protein RodZ